MVSWLQTWYVFVGFRVTSHLKMCFDENPRFVRPICKRKRCTGLSAVSSRPFPVWSSFNVAKYARDSKRAFSCRKACIMSSVPRRQALPQHHFHKMHPLSSWQFWQAWEVFAVSAWSVPQWWRQFVQELRTRQVSEVASCFVSVAVLLSS